MTGNTVHTEPMDEVLAIEGLLQIKVIEKYGAKTTPSAMNLFYPMLSKKLMDEKALIQAAGRTSGLNAFHYRTKFLTPFKPSYTEIKQKAKHIYNMYEFFIFAHAYINGYQCAYDNAIHKYGSEEALLAHIKGEKEASNQRRRQMSAKNHLS